MEARRDHIRILEDNIVKVSVIPVCTIHSVQSQVKFSLEDFQS